MKNTFIVIDGIDGSGKGEMLKKLHNYLFEKDKSINILTTREPTDSVYGKQARSLLKSDVDPMANAEQCLELYCKDREQHLKTQIIPFMANRTGVNIVLCDRYYHSTIAFQHTQGLDLKVIMEKNRDFLRPNLALILDLPAEQALGRIKQSRPATEKFESLDFMKKLRQNFLNLKILLRENIVIIDASKSKEEVFQQIRKEVDKLL